MTTPWYRSFYWRVALGLFGFLALTLAAEAAIFLWMSGQISDSLPARQPMRAARIIATDLEAALEANPRLDLARHVETQYGNVLQTFAIAMRDGRTATSGDIAPEVIDAMRDDLR